jgi:hypothetical protein
MFGKKILLVLCATILSVCILVSFYVMQAMAGSNNTEESSPRTVQQLRPLMRNGKPFFPIGAYGQTCLRFPTSTGSLPFLPLAILREQGWNTVLQHVSDDQTDIKFLNDADAAGFAVILSMHNLVAAQKQDEVAKKVSALKDYPAVLGYYIFDEPENTYSASKEYKNSLHVGSMGLGKFIIDKLAWVKPLIRKFDTDKEHYIFMCVGWGTYYDALSSLYEINLPNEYPTGNTKTEFEGPQANIIYDAKLAAKAAYKAGGQGFCYTPLAINVNTGMENYRPPTINEFRYSVFAPITQGAMGIIYWAGYRCKPPYTEQVVFPVTRQLSQLTPFFLGKWLDEKLSCEPSQSSTPVLKESNLPTVSGCLRQSGDGKYLLLAVNNRSESTSATFKIDIERLPGKAKEFITGRSVPITGGVIKDQMGPYGVCAYVIEPAE